MAIVVDVQTGDVLAMATVDGATDTAPAQVATSGEKNRPVTDQYEPGSTNKVITMAGAIQDGIITPDTRSTRRGSPSPSAAADYEDDEEHSPTMTVARHPRAVVERRDDPDRARSWARTASPTTSDAFGYGQPHGPRPAG